MITLGELQLVLSDTGGDAILRKLGLIDSTAARIGGKPITISVSAPNAAAAAAALTGVGTAATQARDELGRFTSTRAVLDGVAKATSGLGDALATSSQKAAGAAEVAAGADRDAAAALAERARATTDLIEQQQAVLRAATLADPKTRIRDVSGVVQPFLGPGLPTATTKSAATEAESARRIAAFHAETEAIKATNAAMAQAVVATTDDVAAFESYLSSLIAGAKLEDTRADAIGALIPLEEGFAEALKLGNVSLEERIVLAEQLKRVQAGITSGTERVAMPFLGPALPSTTTESAAAASAVATDKLAAAQKRSAAAAGQQGVAVAKTTTGVTMFGRELTRADGNLTSFSKRGLSSLNILAFGFSQFAATGETSLRSIVQASTGVLSFLGTKGAIASLIGTISMGASDAIFGFFNSARAKRRADILADAKAELTIRKGTLEEQTAKEKAQFDQSLTSLRDYYKQRGDVIKAQTAAEVAARQKQIAALNIEVLNLANFTGVGRDKDREEALRNIKQLEAEIVAIKAGGDAQTIENENEFDTRQRAVADQILEFEHKRMEAQGQTHETRLDQIRQEVQAFSRVPLHPGETEGSRAAAVADFERVLTLQAKIEDRQRQIDLITTDFGVRREELSKKVERGLMSESTMEATLADEERQRLDELTKLADEMARFADELTNPELQAAARRIKTEIAATGVNAADLRAKVMRSVQEALSTAGPTEQAMAAQISTQLSKIIGPIPIEFVARSESLLSAARAVDAEFAQLGARLGQTFADAFEAGVQAIADHKNPLVAFGKAWLAGWGQILVDMGKSLLVAGAQMLILNAAMTNPVTAGVAMLAAGALLIAEGTILGAIAHRGGGGGSGGSSGITFAGANDRDLTQRVLLDPDRALRAPGQSSQASGGPVGPARAMPEGMTASAPPQPVIFNFTVIGQNDPQAQTAIINMVNNGLRAGKGLGNSPYKRWTGP